MNVQLLNELIGRELGRNPYGEPLFMWVWSETLMWPAFKTGRMVTKSVDLPIIGKSGTTAVGYVVVPEYRQDRQCRKIRNQWLIAKWVAPESLEGWLSQFPGADFPHRGYYIQTNASLPSFDGGTALPDLSETERFIAIMREQRSMNLRQRTEQIEGVIDNRERAAELETKDEIYDMVPAFANSPGKRGGSVSVPFTKFDRDGGPTTEATTSKD